MKAFLWSLCLHIVLLGLLTYHHFSPSDDAKQSAQPPILAYAYQEVRAKPAPAPVVAEPVKVAAPVANAVKKSEPKAQSKPAKTKARPVKSATQAAKRQVKPAPQPKAFVPVRKPAKVTPPAKPFVPVRKPAMVKAPPAAPSVPLPIPKPEPVVAAKPLPEPAPKPVSVVAAKPLPEPAPKPVSVVAAKPLPEPAPKPAVVTASKPAQAAVSLGSGQATTKAGKASVSPLTTTVGKALSSAQQGDASTAASWREQQRQLALEITAAKADKKPEVGRKVKTFADGSSLIDTNPGCWRVPPPESRKDSIWLSTSVPCKPDTTVEQIDAILEKRRSYQRK